MISLTIENANGERMTEPLPGPGGVLRIAVGEPGCHSGIWRVWANKNWDGDGLNHSVYVGIRDILGRIKYSFHGSNDWRYQMVGDDARRHIEKTGTRVVDRWPRPPEVARGWTKALTIWVPSTDIVPAPETHGDHKDVIWIPRPAAHLTIALQVTLVRPDVGFTTVNGAMPVAGFSLRTGESVLVLVGVHEIDGNGLTWLGHTRTSLLASLNLSRVELSMMENPRLVLHGNDVDGHRMAWDLAILPTAPSHQ